MIRTVKIVGIVAGTPLAILAAILGIPPAVKVFRETLFPSPRVDVRVTSPLTLSYNASRSVLTLEFGLNFDNTAERHEAIEAVSGDLEIANESKTIIEFNDADILFQKDGREVPKNTPLLRDVPRDVRCVIECVVTEMNRPLFTQAETRRVLRLRFKGQKRMEYHQKLCFDLGKNAVTNLFEPRSQPIRFIDTKCHENKNTH